jgi:hypothetical protein
MRAKRLRGMAAVVILVLAAGGCGDVRPAANGAWTGCGNLERPSVVQVRRSVSIPEPEWGSWVRLSVTQRRAPLVRRLYYDLCVIVGHPDHLPSGPISCPADFGLVYSGVFYAADKKLASFSYDASGCQSVALYVGPGQASTPIWGKAAAAEPATFGSDLAAVLGVPAGTVYMG